jgi:hypothetical protein
MITLDHFTLAHVALAMNLSQLRLPTQYWHVRRWTALHRIERKFDNVHRLQH